MEENEQDHQGASFFDLDISPSVIYSLQQTCRWALFVAYVSASAIVLGCCVMFFVWDTVERAIFPVYGAYENIVVAAFVIVMLVYAVFVAFLFVFSYKIKSGLAERNIAKLEQGVSSMKFYFIMSAVGGMLYTLILLTTFLLGNRTSS